MSCQCHQIGGPFIAEDPDCIIHGSAAKQRERETRVLEERAAKTDNPQELKAIIEDLASLIRDIY